MSIASDGPSLQGRLASFRARRTSSTRPGATRTWVGGVDACSSRHANARSKPSSARRRAASHGGVEPRAARNASGSAAGSGKQKRSNTTAVSSRSRSTVRRGSPASRAGIRRLPRTTPRSTAFTKPTSLNRPASFVRSTAACTMAWDGVSAKNSISKSATRSAARVSGLSSGSFRLEWAVSTASRVARRRSTPSTSAVSAPARGPSHTCRVVARRRCISASTWAARLRGSFTPKA